MPLPTYGAIPDILQGLELAPKTGLLSIVVPEEGTNLFINPSSETNPDSEGVNGGGFTHTASSTEWAAFGLASSKLQPSAGFGVSSYYAKLVANTASKIIFVTGQNYVFSVYLYSLDRGSYYIDAYDATNNAVVAAGKVIQIPALTPVRLELTFALSGTVTNTHAYNFRVFKTAGAAGVSAAGSFYLDGWQLEKGRNATTYFDGDQSGCQWLGTIAASNSYRAYNAPGGRIYNLGDLGLQVMSIVGAGLSPIQNISTPSGFLGGEDYQRSIPQIQPIVVKARLVAANLLELHKLRQALINYTAPDPITGEGQPISLRYAFTDDCGQLTGKAVDMQVYYANGLEFALTNRQVEEISLNFVLYNPPGIKNIYESAFSLTRQSTTGGPPSVWLIGQQNLIELGSNNGFSVMIESTTGRLFFTTTTGSANGVAYSILPDYGALETTFATCNGVINTIALARDSVDSVYLGGNFTTPQTYIAKVQPGTATLNALGGLALNAMVRAAIVPQSATSYVIAGGDFTGTAANLTRIGVNNGGWFGLGSNQAAYGANNSVRALLENPYTKAIIFGGDFTQAFGSATYQYICSFVPNWVVNGGGGTNTDVFSVTALGAGFNGGVYGLAWDSLGNLWAVGAFTTAGGQTVNRIAKYNGTGWSAVGPGVNGTITSISIDKNNIVYIAGAFTATSDGKVTFLKGAAMIIGSNYYSIPVQFPTGTQPSQVINLAASGRLAIGTGIVVGGTSASVGFTTVTYAGTAKAFPKLVIKGAGTLYQITNITKKFSPKSLYFNALPVVAGETITFDLNPRNLSITSSLYGNVAYYLLPGSDLLGFAPAPGTNYYYAYMDSPGGGSSINIQTKNLHWSIDGSV